MGNYITTIMLVSLFANGLTFSAGSSSSGSQPAYGLGRGNDVAILGPHELPERFRFAVNTIGGEIFCLEAGGDTTFGKVIEAVRDQLGVEVHLVNSLNRPSDDTKVRDLFSLTAITTTGNFQYTGNETLEELEPFLEAVESIIQKRLTALSLVELNTLHRLGVRQTNPIPDGINDLAVSIEGTTTRTPTVHYVTECRSLRFNVLVAAGSVSINGVQVSQRAGGCVTIPPIKIPCPGGPKIITLRPGTPLLVPCRLRETGGLHESYVLETDENTVVFLVPAVIVEVEGDEYEVFRSRVLVFEGEDITDGTNESYVKGEVLFFAWLAENFRGVHTMPSRVLAESTKDYFLRRI